MSDDPNSAPVVADRATGAVYAAGDLAPLGKPSRKTVSAVWLGVVYANIAVMVLAAGALAAALFFPARPSLVAPELLVTLFMTPAAFLAGLIAGDPGQHS